MKEQQASGTARLIAAALVMLHEDPQLGRLVPDSSALLAARALEISSGRSDRRSFLKRPWFRAMARLIERLTTPGIVLHYAMRKNCIRELARQAIAIGVKQAVVLGAGLDSLGADLAQQFDDLQVWEIDHPATQQLKAQALESLGPTRLQLVPADLSATGPRRILSGLAGFHPSQRTLWVAEGLVMYFDPPIVSRIFNETATMSAHNSRFIFTFMRPDERRRLRFEGQTRLVEWWLRLAGEPFRWGTSPELLPEFVQPWRVLQIYGHTHLKESSPISLDQSPAAGEMICLAEI